MRLQVKLLETGEITYLEANKQERKYRLALLAISK